MSTGETLKTARTKQTLVVVAAALVLSGVFGACFHQHAPTQPGGSASCVGADSETSCPTYRLRPAADDDADSCAICFFNRCTSDGARGAAQPQGVELNSTPVCSPSGVLPESLLARLNEARGPPAA
jgi:hypothetical protein